MHDFQYLIVGGGMTADAAVSGIRQVDAAGSIGIVSAESHPPYNRPPLTKGLWKGKPFNGIWRQAAIEHATIHPGRKIVSLDPANHRVTDDQGAVYGFQKLLLATGGAPRQIPDSPDAVIYFRTLDDYRRLRRLTEQHQRIAVIGGGFIGSEIAAALAMNGKEVVMIFSEAGIGARMFPRDLAGFLNDFYRQKGVEVRAEEEVTGIEEQGGPSGTDLKSVLRIRTRNVHTWREDEIAADGVVAGLGIRPNVELAQAAGLAIGDGIRVDASLRTSHPDIFAAGDVAEFFNPVLGTRLRVEHEDNANTMGDMAGRSMAGESVSYEHLPFFYSDLFELGYEAVGQVDSRLETVPDWIEPYREGAVYYLQDGRVRGALLWNVWEQVDAARHLIAQQGPFRPEDLHGRLLPAHQPA